MTKVKIDTPGVTVEVEADGELSDVAAKALQVFTEAGGWPQPTQGPATGFQLTDRRWTPPTQSSSMHQSPGPYPIQAEAQ